MSDTNNPEIKNFLMTLKTIWVSLGFSHLLLIFVCWSSNKESGFRFTNIIPNFSDEFLGLFAIVFSVMAIIIFIASMLLPAIIVKKIRIPLVPNAATPAELKITQIALIMGMALAESISLLGFVLAFMAHEPAQMLTFVALGLYSHLQKFPSTQLIEKLVSLQKKDGAQ